MANDTFGALRDLLGQGRKALQAVRASAAQAAAGTPDASTSTAVLEDPVPSPNTPPGSPDGIPQHSPSAKPAPSVPAMAGTAPAVYQRILAEWDKIKDPLTGFEYFCDKYVWINNQKHGYVHFKLYPYQIRAAEHFRDNRFVITKKFRQAGMSLLTGVYCLWYSLVHARMQCMVVSIGQRESSKYLQENVREVYESLPRWLKGGLNDKGVPIKWDKTKAYKDSMTEIWLPNRSKIRSIPSGKATGRGFTTKILVIDEAAFIERIDEIWTAIYPTISNSGGRVFVVSTVNGVGGVGGWYYHTYRRAVDKENDFVVADMNHKEHPDYNDPAWEAETLRNLGQRKWDQEVLGKFLASGSTYITAEHLEKMEHEADAYVAAAGKPTQEMGGKLLIWKAFVGPTTNPDGTIKAAHRYAIGADCATAGGLDASTAQVVDVITGEQVAEFKGKLPEDQFALVLAQLGYRYGTAVIAVELNSTAGGAVMMSLDKIQRYKRIWTREDGQTGWLTTVRSRNTLIADLESQLYDGSWKVRSQRLIDELKTFVVTKTGRIEHDHNSHDDLIFAYMIATSPEVIRAATRATPRQPEAILLVKEGGDEDAVIISKPKYSLAEEKAVLKKGRADLIVGTKYGDFVEKMNEVNELAGEDVMAWLLGGPKDG